MNNFPPTAGPLWMSSPERLIQANLDAMIVVDRKGVLRFVNAAAEGLFGRSAADLVGAKFEFPLTCGVTDIDIDLPGGSTRTAQMDMALIRWPDENSRDTVYIATLHDVTGWKRMNGAIRRLNRELEDRLRTREAELKKVAESRSRQAQEAQILRRLLQNLDEPLHRIREYAQALMDEGARHLNPREGQFAGRIVEETSRLHKAIRAAVRKKTS